MKSRPMPPESGKVTINGHVMSWILRRSKTESFFGIRASRVWYLEIKKDGNVVGVYDRGWTTQIPKEDDESAICLSYILDKYGKAKVKKKKEMGSLE